MSKDLSISKKQRSAIKYLVNLLNKNNVSYQATGGLAAICYGATRPLYDVDMDINKKDIPLIQKLLKQYIIDDYHHYKDDFFDMYLMRLYINGVLVDISQIENAYSLTNGKKIKINSNIANSKLMKIAGMNIQVQNVSELVEYKLMIGRDTDLSDVKEIQSSSSS